MKIINGLQLTVLGCILLFFVFCMESNGLNVSVPFVLDHNRMLVEAEIQRIDGSWRNVLLWVDSGNPDFFISEDLARDLGYDLSQADEQSAGENIQSMDVKPPDGVRIGNMDLNCENVKSIVLFEPKWIFSTMHIDANLPAAVLKQYHVIFDYPGKQLTLAQPGSLQPRGIRAPANVNDQTGIVQIGALINGDSLSFALDNGASYSFVSEDMLKRFSKKYPGRPGITGAVGCANIWGWWPAEAAWPVIRLPEIFWGTVQLIEIGIAGLPNNFPIETGVGDWYSQKTAHPVNGFLGPNVYKDYRVEIDYLNSAVYFEKGEEAFINDLDLVGLTLRPISNGGYQVIGIAEKDGKPVVAGIKRGDLLLQVDELKVTGLTMGTVVDALRGKPGDNRILLLERDGKQFTIEAKVKRLL